MMSKDIGYLHWRIKWLLPITIMTSYKMRTLSMNKNKEKGKKIRQSGRTRLRKESKK